MHEMSVIQALLEQVEHFMPECSKLVEVTIEVGQLEHLDDEIMQLAWESTVQDTDLAGARLSIEHIAIRVRCESCRLEFEPEDPAVYVCPWCQAAMPQVLAGSGIVLRHLKVDEPEQSSTMPSRAKGP